MSRKGSSKNASIQRLVFFLARLHPEVSSPRPSPPSVVVVVFHCFSGFQSIRSRSRRALHRPVLHRVRVSMDRQYRGIGPQNIHLHQTILRSLHSELFHSWLYLLNLPFYLAFLVRFRSIPKLARNSKTNPCGMLVVSMTSLPTAINEAGFFQVANQFLDFARHSDCAF